MTYEEELKKRLSGELPPIDGSDIVTPEVDPMVGDIPVDTPEPDSTLRDRLQQAYMLKGATDVGSNLIESITGAKGIKGDAGVGQLQKQVDLRDKLAMAKAKGPTGSQSEKFSQYYVREGKHKGKPIYFQAGQGMFIRDGSKIITEINDQESFKNPYKPMVEKGEYQKALDTRKQTQVEKVGNRPSDKQVEHISNTAKIIDTLKLIKKYKEGVDTGPISSRVQTARGVVADKDPAYTKLEGVSGNFLADYLKSISGAAISELEMQRLKENVPNVTMNDKEFNDKLKVFEEVFKKGVNATIKAYRAQGKDVSGLLDLLVAVEELPEKQINTPNKLSDPGPRPSNPEEVAAWRKARIEYLKSRR